MLDLSQKSRYIFLSLITFAVAGCWGSRPPLPQRVCYHNFADQRQILATTNGLDVLSNLAFFIVGLWGIATVLKKEGREKRFLDTREKIPYLVLFAGATLVSLGSAYYHLSPDNRTLVWDRLPMTIGFIAFLISVVMERISLKIGLRALVPALLVGVTTVIYWSWTESQGRGDLRAYLFVQYDSLIGVTAMMALFPARYTGSIYLFLALVFYFFRQTVRGQGPCHFRGQRRDHKRTYTETPVGRNCHQLGR